MNCRYSTIQPNLKLKLKIKSQQSGSHGIVVVHKNKTIRLQ